MCAESWRRNKIRSQAQLLDRQDEFVNLNGKGSELKTTIEDSANVHGESRVNGIILRVHKRVYLQYLIGRYDHDVAYGAIYQPQQELEQYITVYLRHILIKY